MQNTTLYKNLTKDITSQIETELCRYLDIQKQINKRLTQIFISDLRRYELEKLLNKCKIQISKRMSCFTLPSRDKDLQQEITEYKIKLYGQNNNLKLSEIKRIKNRIKILEAKAVA